MGSPPGFGDLPPALRARAEEIVSAAARRALARAPEFEFASFRIGTRPLPEFAGRQGGRPAGADAGPRGDETVREMDAETHDLVRAVVRIELRRRLARAWPRVRFDPDRPDMILDVRPREQGAGAWFEPQQAFVAGRYRKLSRTMSQTAFHCRRCRGRGARRGAPCRDCGGSGRSVPDAVEDFVCPVFCSALGGRAATFHGSGREDVDVRMLGEGRPFVVTVEEPVRRRLAAVEIAARVEASSGGRVEVRDVRVVDRDERRRVTTEHGAKTYRVVVAPQEGAVLPDDAAQRLRALDGALLAQRNPVRVQRRADVVRERRVRALSVEDAIEETIERAVEDTETAPATWARGALVLRVTTDPGLYVKEFVSGDGGRTAPSVADALGVPCFCAQLDVLDVFCVGAPDARPDDDGRASATPDQTSR